MQILRIRTAPNVPVDRPKIGEIGCAVQLGERTWKSPRGIEAGMCIKLEHLTTREDNMLQFLTIASLIALIFVCDARLLGAVVAIVLIGMLCLAKARF